jgi:S-DNA-T family DNA segregation ATPase FtsK/SpoIIIE
VRLIMVDPKVVELKIFNSLPHMLIPVVTEPKKVPAALKWLLGEMEQRYQIFAKVNVRNISASTTARNRQARDARRRAQADARPASTPASARTSRFPSACPTSSPSSTSSPTS